MDEYIPGEVYRNLVKLMEYRGAALSAQPLDAETVAQKLNHYEFVIMQGNREKTDQRGEALVVTILIAPNSKYSNKSGEFKKLLKGLPKVTTATKSLEVMFVSEQPLTIHIKKHLLQFKAENPKVHVEDYSYGLFMIEAPKHESVPPHILATDAEIEEFCTEHNTSKDKFSKILQSDVQAVWLGLRPGMVTKIIRISETAGTAVMYRICVKG